MYLLMLCQCKMFDYNPQTTVVANFYSMSRDSAYFPDPDSFIPERWDREKGDIKGKVACKNHNMIFFNNDVA